MISIKSLVTILALLFALLAANSEARGGGRGGRGGGRGGHGGGKKQKSSYFDSLTFTTISDVCDAESDIVTCQLRKDADGVESGAFVCRNTTCHHDSTATTVEAAMCVHVNRTLSTDECGCCGGDCPEMCSECACTETVTHHRRSRTISGFEMVNSTSGDIICVEEFKSRDLVARGVATCNSDCS